MYTNSIGWLLSTLQWHISPFWSFGRTASKLEWVLEGLFWDYLCNLVEKGIEEVAWSQPNSCQAESNDPCNVTLKG